MLGTTVTAVDVSSKTVTVSAASGESTVEYEKLLVATGCEPIAMTDFKVPGADLPGIPYLRDVEDADSLVAGINATKATGSPALVVGGGYIGMECAGERPPRTRHPGIFAGPRFHSTHRRHFISAN